MQLNDTTPSLSYPKKNKNTSSPPAAAHAATSSPEQQHPSGARVSPPERWLDVACRACRHMSRLHCDTSTKTCVCLWKAADPDSFNLVTQALTDVLWGNAVICLDRHCSAGLQEDKQGGQKWHMMIKKLESRMMATARGQVYVCPGCSVCVHH